MLYIILYIILYSILYSIGYYGIDHLAFLLFYRSACQFRKCQSRLKCGESIISAEKIQRSTGA